MRLIGTSVAIVLGLLYMQVRRRYSYSLTGVLRLCYRFTGVLTRSASFFFAASERSVRIGKNMSHLLLEEVQATKSR